MGILATIKQLKNLTASPGDLLQVVGLEKARVDYDNTTDEVVLSLVIDGQIKRRRIPCKYTFESAELASLISGVDPLAESSPIVETAPEFPNSQ